MWIKKKGSQQTMNAPGFREREKTIHEFREATAWKGACNCALSLHPLTISMHMSACGKRWRWRLFLIQRDLARAEGPWDQLCEWMDGASGIVWWQTKASSHNLDCCVSCFNQLWRGLHYFPAATELMRGSNASGDCGRWLGHQSPGFSIQLYELVLLCSFPFCNWT